MSNASANIVNFCVIRFILSSLSCDLLLSRTNCIERWQKSQGGEDLAAILILTHPASSIYTTEDAPLSRGDFPKKPINEAWIW
jgi:hypothetical protein